MRIKFKKLFVAIFLCILTTSFAEAIGTHEVGVSPEVSHITYSELNLIVDGHKLNVKESGNMYGISGFYAYHNRLFLREEGRYSWGDVDYSGSGEIKNIPDYLYELRSLIGWEFKPWIHFTPYSGIGYRYLNDNARGRISSDGSQAYLRESNYLYIPIGVSLTKNFGAWNLRITPEIETLIGGRQVSHLDDIKGFPRVSNKQPRGYGARISIEFTKPQGKIDLFIAGFMRHWGIQESKESERFVEPKNSSNEIGVKIGVRF